MTFMGASAHGLYQQLTPIEEGIPTYFPPTEQLSIVGEDVPEIGSNQTFDLMQSREMKLGSCVVLLMKCLFS